jgi:hypothetical protein
MLTRSLAATTLAAAVTLSAAFSQSSRTVNLEAGDCSRINMTFDDLPVARAVRQVTVPMSSAPLDIAPEANGGVRIERGTGAWYSITACIAAAGSTVDEAQRAADAAEISVANGRVRVTAPPATRNWNVQLIVEAPPGSNLRATTRNGPISVEDVSGTFAAQATNGPIALRNVDGDVSARAQNGPISVSGSSGRFDVETQNGPISVTLEGSRWDGTLTARAHNGPLDVRVPDGYASGVEISSSSRSPWNCRLSACRDSLRDPYDGARSVQIGGQPIVVRVSTGNGPVTVR